MISRHGVALALDITMEMAAKHGIPARMSDDDFAALQADPPAWLVQSRTNRTGKRPVWVHLECVVCGYGEDARPKKWWPEFTALACVTHPASEWPRVVDGAVRSEYDGIGSRFIGLVDVKVP